MISDNRHARKNRHFLTLFRESRVGCGGEPMLGISALSILEQRDLRVKGQPELHHQFQASLGYKDKPYLSEKQNNRLLGVLQKQLPSGLTI